MLSYLEFRYIVCAYKFCVTVGLDVESEGKYASISNHITSREINKQISYWCSHKYVAKEQSNKYTVHVRTSFPRCQYSVGQYHTTHRAPSYCSTDTVKADLNFNKVTG
jgi:hypothetical protein